MKISKGFDNNQKSKIRNAENQLSELQVKDHKEHTKYQQNYAKHTGIESK